MASKAWIPTKYWLVNNEGNGNHKFSLCWSSYEDVHDELSRIRSVLKNVSLDHKECPLGARLHSLGKGINKEAANLEARDREVTLVICTQGLPTDSHGCTSSKLRRDFQHELALLGKLPVKIIIRLTTDDERVRDMFNTMDSKFESIDVLDDYWGEVRFFVAVTVRGGDILVSKSSYVYLFVCHTHSFILTMYLKGNGSISS